MERGIRKKGRRGMERNGGTGKKTVVLVFVRFLICLRLYTDILRLSLTFSLCRVVQNVRIFSKKITSPLLCYWELANRGQFSLLLVSGPFTKWVF